MQSSSVRNDNHPRQRQEFVVFYRAIDVQMDFELESATICLKEDPQQNDRRSLFPRSDTLIRHLRNWKIVAGVYLTPTYQNNILRVIFICW